MGFIIMLLLLFCVGFCIVIGKYVLEGVFVIFKELFENTVTATIFIVSSVLIVFMFLLALG